jgi:hypothetical protein
MIDPKQLLERASQLAEQARSEDDSNIRERLTRMAELYQHLASHEAWARENPPSMATITDALNPKM